MELKTYEVQKDLVNQQMLHKREQARKKIIDSETKGLFADILNNTLHNINKNKMK